MPAGSDQGQPRFLSLPARPEKPRTAGLTHVLDGGLSLAAMRDLLDSVGRHVDVWKFGYGLSYIDDQLAPKIALLRSKGINPCPGGTLAEICWKQNKTDQYFDWLEQLGMGCVEISNGATGMPTDAKRELVSSAAARGFEVFAEVGSKDPETIATPAAWVAEAQADLAAGATWIVAEGRESGTVGLYDTDGRVRPELVDALESLDAEANIIYEAPKRAQQAWLIRHVGPNVNVGNVAAEAVLSLEALRLGLRADTIGWVSNRQQAMGPQCSS